uniref:Uncharacterized protein n=1 Tax=Gopherus agassizii TaxID=38772 RepID=A0A452INN1_9SAUR
WGYKTAMPMLLALSGAKALGPSPSAVPRPQFYSSATQASGNTLLDAPNAAISHLRKKAILVKKMTWFRGKVKAIIYINIWKKEEVDSNEYKSEVRNCRKLLRGTRRTL